MIAELDAVWAIVREDDAIRVVVMRADGRASCIGRDAEEIATTPPEQLNPLGKTRSRRCLRSGSECGNRSSWPSMDAAERLGSIG